MNSRFSQEIVVKRMACSPHSPTLAPGRTHRPVPYSGQDRADRCALPGHCGTRPPAHRTRRTITPSPMDCSVLAEANTEQITCDDLLRPTGCLDVAVVQVLRDGRRRRGQVTQ